MIKNIGILTFHSPHNYGSMLQAYALQTYLSKGGYNVSIINFRPPIQRKVYCSLIDFRHPRSTFFHLIQNPKASILSFVKHRRFETFLKEKLNVTKELKETREVFRHVINSSYDAIIVGSDQIWNTSCMDYDISYLLPFEGSFRKIAYAPSLGPIPEVMSMTHKSVFKSKLTDFYSLSTRETQGASFLSDLLAKDIQCVLDPTLLLNYEEFNHLVIKKPIIADDYIFYYSPLDSNEMFKPVLEFAKIRNIKIVVSQNRDYYKHRLVTCVGDSGPIEFLNIIKNCKFAIGKSFHLIAFSIIFNRQFFAIDGRNDSRLSNILKQLKLDSYAVEVGEELPDNVDIINYSELSEEMEKLKSYSINYIKTALQ